jgi:hypothetical protein
MSACGGLHVAGRLDTLAADDTVACGECGWGTVMSDQKFEVQSTATTIATDLPLVVGPKLQKDAVLSPNFTMA